MLAALARSDLELSEVTRLVSSVERSRTADRTVSFGLSGNVTIDLMGVFLRKQAALHGHRAQIHVGNFDDHLGNAKRFAADGLDVIILVNLFDAFLPAFEARLPLLDSDVVAAQADRLRDELRLVLEETRKTKHVFVSLVHRLAPPTASLLERDLDDAIDGFNEIIVAEASRHNHVQVVASGALAAQLGWKRAHDLRSYGRFRAPFTPAFCNEFAEQVYRLSRGFGSYYYKALVLDCDNTLWGGVVGEDLLSGIKLAPHGYPASVYWQVQHELLALQERGVLLCLCTKNEPADVDAVLASHPDMVLRDRHFAAKRVNWDDKVTNLERLAADLNIGLDAMVFVDDSPFECEAVRGRLPMVRTFQVPSVVADYPRLIQEIKELFAVGKISEESAAKTEQYRLRAQAARESAKFATQEEYLASLRLKVTVRRDDRASIARIAELTQKSNQFNLTTRRYTDAEIRSLMEGDDASVYSIHVADKFGDSGLTGVVIVRYHAGGEASIDTFLMSCRILGRGVEVSFWGAIFEQARLRGCRRVTAEYLPTAKNAQVRDFWDRLDLELILSEADGRREYVRDLAEKRLPSSSHIEVIHVF
jgi:FkbH-like protein